MEDDFGRKVIEQAFNLWINPEIERRREAGRLPDDFDLYAVQVIMNVDTDAPEVRLNDEVRAALKVRATRDIEKGQALKPGDFDHIEAIELTELDPNAGHFTMLRHEGSWYLNFDFRYNAARISEHIAAAREFLDCSAFSLEKRQTRAFIENLFSAAELMAKGLLLVLPDKSILGSKTHKIVSSRFNSWSKLGNTDPRYVKLLNRLSLLRSPARYLRKDLKLAPDEAKGMLAVAEEMFETLCATSPRRVPVPDGW